MKKFLLSIFSILLPLLTFAQEAQEIEIIKSFLPTQMSEDEIAAAVTAAVESLGASSLKDMGPAMAHLRENFAGRMDFGKASALLKQKLAG